MNIVNFMNEAKRVALVNIETKSITRTPRVEVTGQTAAVDKIEDFADAQGLVTERVNDRRLVVAYFSKN